MQLLQVSSDISDYLVSSDVIDFDNEAIKIAVRRITADMPDEMSMAKAIFEFVRDDIRHTFDAGADEVTCKASDVLKNGHGVCYAKSHLLAAMMRCSGIPAGFCYQLLASDTYPGKYEVHGLNAIYLKSLDRWVRVDARGNKPGVNVQFDINSDMRAFKPDEGRGERDDRRIFAAPVESVLKTLIANKDAKTLAHNLPENL